MPKTIVDGEELGLDNDNTLGTDTVEAGETRESIVNDAVNNAELELKLEDLADSDTELTAESLRASLGDVAEGLTDEELMAEWDKANGKTEGEVTPFTLPNGLKLYGEDGKEIAGLDKMTLAQLFSDKVQFGYNALGKEQKKALAEVFRNASLGHYNEQKMQTLAQERTKAYEMYQNIKTEHDAWAQDRQVWLSVLTAASQGNIEPLKQLLKAYGDAGNQGPQTESTIDPRQEAEYDQAGMNWVTTEANKLAEQYGANPLEIAQAIVYLANQEPKEFLTQEKLTAIVQYEIPALLERYQYTQKNGGTAVTGANDEVTALKKQVAELMADKQNASTQKVRDRTKKIPAAGGGRTAGAGDSVPTFKSREQYKRWIRDEVEE